MKKINKKKAVKFIFLVFSRTAILTLIIGLFAIVPSITYVYSNSKERMQEKFFGKTAEYQGVLTLWNVDTFEGGSGSRSGYLEKICMAFEKQNKGALIKVENLTVDQMLANLKIGVYPNLFSFGTGVSGYLKDKMITLSDSMAEKLMPNFYSSGKDGSVLKAVAWSYGGYSLITSSDRIEKAGKEVSNNIEELAFYLSYDKQLKKTTKHTFSLTFGANDYVGALNVFSRHFSQESVVELARKGVVDDLYNNQTPYQAYVNYVSRKSSMLLGTQRDIFRMENKVMAGAELDCLTSPLSDYTDLVSYISIIENSNKAIQNVCMDFVKFLLADESQAKLEGIGMLSPTGVSLYKEGGMKLLEQAFGEHTIVASAF